MKIAVYCGASVGKQEIYTQAAENLGLWLVKNHHELVYGGGKIGLMGILSQTVLKNGGKAIGVIPEFLKEREIAQSNLTELHVVQTMVERKALMADLATAFIALPGGPGTLEEISEMVSWSRIGQNPYPCVFYNVNHYYDALGQMYDTMVTDGFLTAKDRQKILFSDSLTEIATFIKNYQAPALRQY